MSEIHHQPEHCNTINTYLFVDDDEAAVAFYAKAFDGVLGDLMGCSKWPMVDRRLNSSSTTFTDPLPDFGSFAAP